jgi:hypothetical protein
LRVILRVGHFGRGTEEAYVYWIRRFVRFHAFRHPRELHETRRREFQTHREWMLRAAAIGIGIATVRVVAFPLYWLVGGSALALVGPTFWLGLGLSTAVAEWWIWYSHRSGDLAPF